MPFPLVPIIAAAASIISGIVANRSAKKQNRETNKANMQLAQYQTEANQSFVEQQNQYNTPAMQMSRYADAGLNPNLIYGQGSSGNQSAPVRAERAVVDEHYTPFQIPEMLGPFQDYQMRKAQIDSVQAGTENTRAEIANKTLERLVTMANLNRKTFDLEQAKVLAPYNQDIRHGQAQQAYPKLLQELMRVDQQKLLMSFQKQQLQRGAIGLQNDEENLIYNQLKNQLFRRGVTPSDNILLRLLVRSLGDMSFSVDTDKFKRDLHLK